MAIDKVEYWTDIAEYDIETAEAMYATKRWLYVGFMCHQVIEKMLKAYWCGTREDEPPYIHHLANLAIRSNIYEQMSEEQRKFIAMLMPMNIEARYPAFKEELAKTLSDVYCRNLIDKTKELTLWIKDKLSKSPEPIKEQ